MTRQESTGFNLLAPSIQKWIWNRGWNELRDIQEEAITPILSSKTDVIIASATASGKTEAAYLPICSYLSLNQEKGIRVLYVSPLKALINDQFRRLEELCEYCNIPVQSWHGDIDSSKKKKLLDNPEGILLITPESLEAIFVNHGNKIPQIFNQLSFIIIDELHAFLDNERGKQLQSLLYRIELAIKREIQRVGLSATIGDMTIAAKFLRDHPLKPVKMIHSKAGERELRLQILGFKRKQPDLNNPGPEVDEQITENIFRTLRGSDNLIFANSRSSVECLAVELGELSEKHILPNEFFPHHGNLSKELREDTEQRLKDKCLPTNVICTSTLEMGIDIGSVKSVAQIGCPYSIGSIRQRLGRSGRNDTDPSILRIYITEDEIIESSHLSSILRESLFQSIAMMELLLRKWIEPPDGKSLHLSTLIQQLLSIIAQHGGINALNAWKILCQSGTFKGINQRDFALLLKTLGSHDILSQMTDGTLVLGIQGERIVNHFTFFAAFNTYEEFRLVAGDKTLGRVPINFPLFKDDSLIFGGKRWIIIEVNNEQKLVLLRPSLGGTPPRFSSEFTNVHDEIRKEMLRIYVSDYIPKYLNKSALELFIEGRENFKRLRLDEFEVISKGKDTLLFPWIGNRSMRTLNTLLISSGLKSSTGRFLLEVQEVQPEEVVSHLEIISTNNNVSEIDLASLIKNKINEKYDRYLPEELLNAEAASRMLDINGAIKCAASIIDNYRLGRRPIELVNEA